MWYKHWTREVERGDRQRTPPVSETHHTKRNKNEKTKHDPPTPPRGESAAEGKVQTIKEKTGCYRVKAAVAVEHSFMSQRSGGFDHTSVVSSCLMRSASCAYMETACLTFLQIGKWHPLSGVHTPEQGLSAFFSFHRRL